MRHAFVDRGVKITSSQQHEWGPKPSRTGGDGHGPESGSRIATNIKSCPG